MVLILDNLGGLVVIIAHLVLCVSVFLSPSSILDTTPTSLLVSAGISAIPVLIHFYSPNSITLDFTFILITVIPGAFPLPLPHPTQSPPPQIRRLTFPVAT